jgi:DNA-binding MarR family transcriptional regulator
MKKQTPNTPAPVGIAPQGHILALCHMLTNRVGRAFAPTLERFGLTAAQWRVIMTLATAGSATGKEITGRWAMDKMAVNRAIAGLERRGLVTKSKNAEDRRRIDLALTPAGTRLYAEVLPATNMRYHMLLEELSETEVSELRNMLARLIAHADELPD